MKKKYECPYIDCHCRYGSTLALNLHIKLKHNGGTKKEREAYAVGYTLILEVVNIIREKGRRIAKNKLYFSSRIS